ncbi:hypothetical protein ACQCVP_16370 [Rossellomorea vietnamensis]|uniref:hypothetical protein n=1 Tax=Rossellomorea vietnamensis TaxID=218284 RepID=UPI003CF05AD1
MQTKIIGVYSTGEQLISDIETRQVRDSESDILFFTVDPEQYEFVDNETSLKGNLLETSSSNSDSGIHSLATAFDEDDGSVELMRLEKVLRDNGFSEEDAQECKTYLHKGMIVAAEKV